PLNGVGWTCPNEFYRPSGTTFTGRAEHGNAASRSALQRGGPADPHQLDLSNHADAVDRFNDPRGAAHHAQRFRAASRCYGLDRCCLHPALLVADADLWAIE